MKTFMTFYLVLMSLSVNSETDSTNAANSSITGSTHISIAMADWCPYSGDCKIGKGYVPELLEAVFSRAGLEVSFENVPWSRGIIDTRSGRYDGLLNPAKGIASDLYYSNEETGFYTYCYYTKPNDKWVYSGAHSLKSRKTATLKDAGMSEDKAFIENGKNKNLFVPIAYTESYMEQVTKMLFSNRVDTIVNSPFVTKYYYKIRNANSNVIRNAGCISKNKVWLGLTPAIDKKRRSETIGRILDREIRLLREDGTIDRIMSKYGLSDWK